jgi:CTP:molybdopterin cytidylyltransferase MocA
MTTPPPADLCGIVLAAGAGSRMGTPKALVRDADGLSWLARAVALLDSVGCRPIVVVLGARGDEAEALVPDGADVVVVRAERWADGMSESLRAGLAAASGSAALVTLVDLPDLPHSVARAVVDSGVDPSSLRRAVFSGRPGHPVLIGRDHWAQISRVLRGDRGARDYLEASGVVDVDCSALSEGHDIDAPPID